MREIKFRAWEINWLNKETGQPQGRMMQWEDIRDDFAYIQNVTSHFILTQYTGLKDTNNKEIYEGDIVRCSHDYDNYINCFVAWREHLAGFYYVDKSCEDKQWLSMITMFNASEEIIGNIYENPELLTY